MKAKITHIFICPKKGEPMLPATDVVTKAGFGIIGDRYATGEGSWNVGKPGKRQVTLISSESIKVSGFEPAETRRNLVTEGIELPTLIGKKFMIGAVTFFGVKYCTPCDRPSQLNHRERSFKDAFRERGGLIAEVCTSGVIRVGDEVVEIEELRVG